MTARLLQQSLRILILLTLLLGFAYPALVTAIARVAFPAQAAGSVVMRDKQLVGSRLLGQNFTAPGYCWGRPSATGAQPYDAMASSGSNLGPSNPELIAAVQARRAALQAADPLHRPEVPIDLVTASASGLDPDISLAGALWQAPRIAAARGIDATRVRALIDRLARRSWLGFLGEPRVNVLELNLALDAPR
ncbi:MAG: potassium-transporting ATPase subunit KdpC [Gammaproteobacteria bacterium]|nr:potassium-transporting ATPase subunit KdpC [Gammaproteobacteria bacterium]